VQVESANDAMGWSASPRIAPVCSWVSSQTRFTAGSLLARFADLPATDILQLLHRLVAAGILSVE